MNDISSFRDKINSVVSIFGHIELFVNSAGVHSENFDFWNMTECEYDRVMDINLKGVYFFAQSAAKYLRDNNLKVNYFLYLRHVGLNQRGLHMVYQSGA